MWVQRCKSLERLGDTRTSGDKTGQKICGLSNRREATSMKVKGSDVVRHPEILATDGVWYGLQELLAISDGKLFAWHVPNEAEAAGSCCFCFQNGFLQMFLHDADNAAVVDRSLHSVLELRQNLASACRRSRAGLFLLFQEASPPGHYQEF